MEQTNPETKFNFATENMKALSKLLTTNKDKLSLKSLADSKFFSGLRLVILEGLQFAKLISINPQLEGYFKRLNIRKIAFEKYLTIFNNLTNIH